LWHEIAKSLGTEMVAVIFWRRFFALTFELQRMWGDLSFIPEKIKKNLNRHFEKMSNHWQGKDSIKKAYFGFTTWTEDVVL